MPKQRQAPIVLTPQQQAASSRQRGQTYRQIAASSNDPSARASLMRRAEELESKAEEIERAAAQTESPL